MDSIELVKLLKHEKEKGLSLLYDKYAAALNGIVLRMVKTEAVAEEVLQQTFLKIAHSIESYDADHSSLFTWMSRIARQEALAVSGPTEERGKAHASLEHQPASPLLSAISPENKAVLDLIYLLGYTPLETAHQLDLPVDTVKTRLRMAVDQMRQILQNDPDLLSKTLFLSLSLTAVS